jgi:hypothetical protein
MSRARKNTPLRWARRNLGRPALLLVLTLLGLLAMVELWPRKVTGMPEARWNQIKVDWRAEADVLILGDSRGNSSVLPKVMLELMPEQRIKNFAFPGSAYVDGYVEAGLKALDPKSKDPIVIFTFSSKTLTTNREGWPPVMERGWSEVWKWRHIPNLMAAFEPVPKWEFINTARGQSHLGLWREFREDGSYIGGATWKKRPPTIEEAEAVIGKHRVDEAIIAGVMTDVATLRARGIRVFGVRTPSSIAIEALENRLQEMNEPELVRRFTEAGGTWIDVPDRDAYKTYDLSHLEVADAERFTRWFTQQILSSSSTTTAGAAGLAGTGTSTTTTTTTAP